MVNLCFTQIGEPATPGYLSPRVLEGSIRILEGSSTPPRVPQSGKGALPPCVRPPLKQTKNRVSQSVSGCARTAYVRISDLPLRTYVCVQGRSCDGHETVATG